MLYDAQAYDTTSAMGDIRKYVCFMINTSQYVKVTKDHPPSITQ